eukprot:CAMPEP_0206470682 /NCGR_PEP_ID=MMETSP0324_2-20121206/31086_1 /ASSEMBLY_ACC=CAM_ASM_000836 /TAXON_ID=2866 /ORGANISM="Crypthecodinium cohnii, Strain Seligo" /LENGTH=43 /DNA_ID= /DNA_START= /DNA_END= /DNA_ORIENTATION=
MMGAQSNPFTQILRLKKKLESITSGAATALPGGTGGFGEKQLG